jgi:hypothetical protein
MRTAACRRAAQLRHLGEDDLGLGAPLRNGLGRERLGDVLGDDDVRDLPCGALTRSHTALFHSMRVSGSVLNPGHNPFRAEVAPVPLPP